MSTYVDLRADLDLDLVTHDIKKFFSLMLKRNGYVLEQLFSPLIVQTTTEHEELKAITIFLFIHSYYGLFGEPLVFHTEGDRQVATFEPYQFHKILSQG